jgi:hypothetical protein
VFSAVKAVQRIDKKEHEQWYLGRLRIYAQKGSMSLEEANERVARTLQALVAEYKRRRLLNLPLAAYEVLTVSPIPGLVRGLYRRIKRGKVLWRGDTLLKRAVDAARRHSPAVVVAHNSVQISRIRKLSHLHGRSVKQQEIRGGDSAHA